MSAIFELRGFLEEDGQRRSFYLSVSLPRASVGGEDFYCQVHAPELFGSDKEIFGADEEQAQELAVEFAKSLLRGRRLVDQAGQPIDVGRLKI